MILELKRSLGKTLLILGLVLAAFLMVGMKAQAATTTTTATITATYTVVSGDSLYKLGVLFGSSADLLIKGNNLATTMIMPGQRLVVPAEIHVVSSGESMFLIARKHGISLFTLQKANNKWDDAIYPGQKLIVPKAIGTTGVIPYTAADVDLLARLIMSEAEGEPYTGKVAVGAVVVNRVQSGQFPTTIKEVVYQRINGYWQFTPVMIGTINKPASSECVKAAYEALAGVDPTNGALFYFDKSATNQWLLAKPVSIVIQDMIFSF